MERTVRIGRVNGKIKPNETPVRIDRKTLFGNPFVMVNEDQRDRVCNSFDKHFSKKINEDKKYKQALDKLVQIKGDIVLQCWCSPKRCHGRTIKRYIDDQDITRESK